MIVNWLLFRNFDNENTDIVYLSDIIHESKTFSLLFYWTMNEKKKNETTER